MKIVFMGTPAFAVPALEQLVQTGQDISCVYTQPPRPFGRGYKEKKSEIHACALSHHLEVRTPVSLRDKETQQAFAALKADIAVVAAYGLLLPPPILTAFPFGCINIHPSLLPRWRGAAPIQRPIWAGDKTTGIAIMQMDEGLDTGDILLMEEVPLDDNITAGALHDKLAVQGAALLIKVLTELEKGTLKPMPQPSEGVMYAKKLTKEEGKINWSEPSEVIERKIRAFTPWPGAYFFYQDEQIKVMQARIIDQDTGSIAGTILDDQLTIACGKGALQPVLLQRPGKKPLDLASFLRGFPLPKGTVLS